MITYATVGTNDPARSLQFYDKLLGTIGVTRFFDHPRGGAIYANNGKFCFGVLTPFNGEPASVGNGTMIGFELEDEEQVRAFHARALELGASDEGEPGFRGGEDSGYYFSYLRDFDGNKICAFKAG